MLIIVKESVRCFHAQDEALMVIVALRAFLFLQLLEEVVQLVKHVLFASILPKQRSCTHITATVTSRVDL